MISLINIQGSYQVGGETVHALWGVSVRIAKNEYVAITGTSGFDKSTLMNIIGCLDVPDAGSYSLNGRDVSGMTDDELALARNADIGFIFQSFHLLPRLTALDWVFRSIVPTDSGPSCPAIPVHRAHPFRSIVPSLRA